MDKQTAFIGALVEDVIKKIDEEFDLDGKDVASAGKYIGYFTTCLFARLIASTDVPIDKVNEAIKELLEMTLEATEGFNAKVLVKDYREHRGR